MITFPVDVAIGRVGSGSSSDGSGQFDLLEEMESG
jgi:hypothetical protein